MKSLNYMLLSLFFFIMFFSSCSKKETDLSNMKLNGKVKSINISYSEGIEESGDIIKTKEKKIEMDIYTGSNIYGIYNGTFNKDGMFIETISHSILCDSTSLTKSTYKYDEKGNLINRKSEELVDSIKKNDSLNKIYNEENKLIEDNYSSVSNTKNINIKTTYKYDIKGLKIEDAVKFITTNNNSGIILVNSTSFSLFKYNSDQLLKEKIENYNINTVYSNGEPDYLNTFENVSKTTYEYNDKKELISEVTWYKSVNGDYIIDTENKYNYDKQGNISYKTSKWAYDNFTNKSTYIYNEKGLEINETNYSKADSQTYTYKYEYDKMDNWIRMIEFKNNKIYVIVDRAIIYY